MDESTYVSAERALWSHYGLEPKDHVIDLATVGTRARVLEVGTGEPVVFLHGSPTSGSQFASLVAELEGVRSILPDLPPGGMSDPFEVTPDNAAILLDHVVTDLLDALGIESAHLVASSAGSTYALKAAARTRNRVRTIVHLGAPWMVDGIAVPSGEKMMLTPIVRGLLAALRPGRRMQASMHKSIGHAASVDAGRIPNVYWNWYDALIRETSTFREQIRMLVAFKGRGRDYDVRFKVSDADLAVQPQTLWLWGENEPMATVEDARGLIDRMPDAELELLPDAGHLPWLDDPAHVAASIRAILEPGRSAA